MLLDPSKIKVFTTSVVAEIGLATIWNYYFFHFVSGIWDIIRIIPLRSAGIIVIYKIELASKYTSLEGISDV